MVAIDTVNPAFGGPAGGQTRLVEQLECWATAWGLTARRLPVAPGLDNLLLVAEAGPQAPWVLFDSHLDTVAVAGMTIPPFELGRSANRLHGRGACDTKGSGAAMLWALADFARAGARRQTAAVLFTIDEESGMTGARAFARHHLPAWRARLRGVVVGEPTGLRPVVATNGVLRWTMRTGGVAAHSSDPSRGRSAISAMVRVVDAFESRYVPAITATHPLTGRAAASLNVIRGGTQVNVIPDECVVECDRRLIPGEDAAAALAACERTMPEPAVIERESIYAVPPLSEYCGEDFVRSLVPAFEQAGLPFVRSGAPYVTNGSIYAAAGAPVLVTGPGEAAQAHSKDEWVSVEQLTGAAKLYRAIMDLP
jgi:acetylornithine deacetylase